MMQNSLLEKTLSALKSQGADAPQIISAIVNHACPQGGSLDEISSKNSATAALSEYLEKYPDTDIFHLSDDQNVGTDRYISWK